MSAALLVGAMLAVTLGTALLALSQQRHWNAVMGTGSKPGNLPQRLGWLLISVSLVLTILRDGGSFGALSWPLQAGFGALLTSGALTWMPGVMKPLARWFGR
ncbi:MAG: DUF3325 domain-containing protein [Steroidobacteraceae bacterium]|jgi:hypothetical protein|nr:DUF3325 domain-containing protein [Steroidobacteraceae bacterium]